jgi:hypothetical protein
MKNINLFFLFLTLHLTAQTPRQVLDLIPGTVSTFNDVQDELKIGVGNRVLFVVYRQFKYEPLLCKIMMYAMLCFYLKK